MIARADTRSSSARRGQLRLVGVALAMPDWRQEVNSWCDSLGLEPPTAGGNGSSTTRPEPLSVSLVDANGPAPTYLVATTDDLDAALGRLTRTGSKLLAPPNRSEEGRFALVEGPAGIALRVVQPATPARLGPRPGSLAAEDYLRRSLGASALALAVTAGFLAHLMVRNAPAHQVSFGFLVAAIAIFAGLASLIGYPAGVMSGQDDHARRRARVTRSQAAAAEGVDPAKGWTCWWAGLHAALVAAALGALLTALASFALLGRPIGFWLLWAWTALVGGAAGAWSGGLGRRRGLLFASRRSHRLEVNSPLPDPLLRRVWLQGALPIGVANGLINGLLAWSTYRFGVTSAVVSSESGGAVIIVSVLAWFLGHQWGRADLAGGRAEVRAAHALPPKVRLGPQGAVVAVVIELIALGVVAHMLGHPPSPLIASCFRGIGAGLAGAVVFGLAAVAGALGAEADERESVLPQAEEAPS